MKLTGKLGYVKYSNLLDEYQSKLDSAKTILERQYYTHIIRKLIIELVFINQLYCKWGNGK